MTTSEVISCILFPRDELLWMEELSIGSSPHFIDYCRFQVQENASGYVFACTSFREEGVERIVSTPNSFVRGHLAVRLDAVLETEEFPASVSDLDTSLPDVD